MHIVPLGRMAGMPAAGQASSGYLLHHDDTTIMLDAGPGTALRLSEHLDGGGALAAVFISHAHTDHLLDLLPIGKMLLRRRLLSPDTGGGLIDERVPLVPLLVPAGTAALLRSYAALFPVTTQPVLDRAFDLAFRMHEYTPGETIPIADLRLRPELLRHAAPNCGLRIEAGGLSAVYTGDTGLTPALTRLADRADLLLCESTLQRTDRSDHGHLSSADAGRVAAEAAVGSLVLTHFATTDPVDHAWHRAQASAVFNGPVDIARVGTPLPVISRKALT